MKNKLRKIPTPAYLAAVALHYLGRYAASETSLRRVLINRIRRAAMQHPAFAADAAQQAALQASIDKIVEGHIRTGALNDAAFAATKVNSLRRQGRSRRVIQQKLAIKGIASETIKGALVNYDDEREPEEVEMKAALALTRRRKLGPYRKPVSGRVEQGDEFTRRRKEMAVLARAGYGMDIIRKVLDLARDDEAFDGLDGDF